MFNDVGGVYFFTRQSVDSQGKVTFQPLYIGQQAQEMVTNHLARVVNVIFLIITTPYNLQYQ